MTFATEAIELRLNKKDCFLRTILGQLLRFLGV
jgi:hypothetical protein